MSDYCYSPRLSTVPSPFFKEVLLICNFVRNYINQIHLKSSKLITGMVSSDPFQQLSRIFDLLFEGYLIHKLNIQPPALPLLVMFQPRFLGST